MSEHFPGPEHEREVDRIELDLSPLVEHYGDRDDGAYELSQYTKRINAELSKRGIYVALYLDNQPLDTESNHQSQRRVFDEEHINDAILKAWKRSQLIDDAAARVIASQLHEGQESALYALTSSGAIAPGLLEEIHNAAGDAAVDPLARSWAKALEEYVMVRVQRNRVEPVEGWSRLWLGADSPESPQLDFTPPPPNDADPIMLETRTVGEWRSYLLVNENGESTVNRPTSENPYGATYDQVAWWAIAGLEAYYKTAPEHKIRDDELSRYLFGMALDSVPGLGRFVARNLSLIAEEIRANLDLEGGDDE